MLAGAQSRSLAAVLAAAIALSACGGEDEGADAAAVAGAGEAEPASVPDPCGLLTEAEVAAVMGEPTASAKLGSAPAGPGDEAKQCTWSGPKPPAYEPAAPKTIVLAVYGDEKYFAGHEEAGGSEPVRDLGDDAAFVAGSTVMWVQDGLTLQLQFVWSERPRSQVEGLARKAAGRVG